MSLPTSATTAAPTPENLFNHYDAKVRAVVAALIASGELPEGLPLDRLTIEPPREASHGDLSSNVGMVLAKPAKRAPRELAQLVGDRLALDASLGIRAVESAGPGFLNLRLDPDVWWRHLRHILARGARFGDGGDKRGAVVNVEYVSANPTGPLHVGHTRGAIVGDVLANLLAKAGYAVTREYYINDAGAQIDKLARSVHLRYLQALGRDIGPWPEGLYPGDYLVPVGAALAAAEGAALADAPEEDWIERVRRFAVDAMMALIREDLALMGIRHDVFTSEHALAKAGKVEAAFQRLVARDLVYQGVLEPPKGKKVEDYEARELTLFRATKHGDDADWPLKKSDGGWAYIAPDIAYHLDKFERGFTSLIDVVGVDHAGWVKRITAATAAVTDGGAAVDVKLCALVNLLKDGEPAKMSKRAGTFVTARDVVEEVGLGAVRFMMMTRRNDQPLDFDFAKVVEQSKDNPVFYVQYAHARASSVERHAALEFDPNALELAVLDESNLKLLNSDDEIELIRALGYWPRLVESAALAHEPHRVAFYLGEVAARFHGLWNKGNGDATLRFIVAGDMAVTAARLALLRGVKLVIASGLAVLGVAPLEEMR